MNAGADYAVYAIRYAELPARPAVDVIMGADRHEQAVDMDYYVWAIVGAGRTIVVDTGFNAATATRRGRRLLREPVDGLRLIGVDPTMVNDVVITHLHYDHAGTFDRFPIARFHLQDAEMNYATGRSMLDDGQRQYFEVDDVCGMVRQVYEKRVVFHDGDVEIAPGISLHKIGGHTMGLQCVRIDTPRSRVVLASDAAHLYANLERRLPFPGLHDETDAIAGFDRVRELAGPDGRIIPGHDPEVLERYPAPSEGLRGIVARLD